mgnify:CR=1 FL=1
MKSGIVRLLALITVVVAAQASAQNYPNRPIRFISPYAPGGGTDLLARLVAQKLTERLGQSVVVENRPGAGSVIGTDLVAKAPPDGYTLLVVAASVTMSPSLYKLPFDPVRDLAPISQLTSLPNILVVHPSLPVKSTRELIALAKARPGELNYAAGTIGAAPHLASELFNAMAHTNIVRIGYKGTGPSVIALLGGEVQVGFIPPIVATQHIKAGKVRALGFTGTARLPALPEVPTIAEAGVPGFRFVGNWDGWFAPAGTPETVLTRIHADVMKALVHRLLRMRVRPYYLYQMDLITGGSHFKVDVRKGLEIIRALRGHTTGYAVPQYVIDAPGGGGKVPINPGWTLSHNHDRVVIRNYEGKVFEYPEDPQDWPAPKRPVRMREWT